MKDMSTIPEEPGCYLYKDRKGIIIYIGKAKNLRKRVSQYFQKNNLDPKTEALVKRISDVDYIVTDNEVEALILESNLIKKHQPRYNIDLKDSKRYAYLELTDEDFPRIILARKRAGSGRFYGPFVSASERDYIKDVLVKAFRLRTCKRFPKKPCLRYHIKLCEAPCVGLITKADYSMEIKHAEQVLKGNISEVIAELDQRMKDYSRKKYYESALEMRNQINALMHLKERQKMERQKSFDEDIINYIVRNDTVYLMVFNVHHGTIINKKEFVFSYDPNFFSEFIVQYYSEENVPAELIVPKPLGHDIGLYLERLRKKKIAITVPRIGEKKQLLVLIKKNIEISFFGDMKKLEELKKSLKLQDIPSVIECFDVSHLSGTSTVASMVQFRNAKPDKSNYRRFKIKSVAGIDDFASIAEVVRRRYSRLKSEGKSFPDLIVIDGGKGQLHSALNEMKELNVKIPVISIAKRLEDIYVPGLSIPYRLDRKSTALRFIQEIRDEAHRFAIQYNRLLRKKESYNNLI